MILEGSAKAAAARCGIVVILVAGASFGISRIHPEPVAARAGTAVIHPWAKGGASAGASMAAFVVLENGGDTPERLIAISSPLAERTVMIEIGRENGSARVQELDALTLAPGTRIALRPGQRQIMLIGARGSIEPGSWIPITFTFERGGALLANLRVESLGEPEHDDHR